MAYNNPYQSPYINYGNQFYQPQAPRFQTPDQQYVNQMQQPVQPVQQAYKPTGLQGKFVDSKDTAKTAEFPFDGSISYFPLTDGSMIITKQLQQDGTTKITEYKPIEEDSNEALPNYLTVEQFNEEIKKIDVSKEFKDDIKNIKRELQDLKEDFKDMYNDMKERKK